MRWRRPADLSSLFLFAITISWCTCVLSQEGRHSESVEPSPAERINEIERELIDLERLARYGTDPIRQVAEELENEFVSIANQLERMDPDLDANDISRLRDQQNLLSLYLWQMQRFGSTFAPRPDYSNSPMSRLSKLLRESEIVKDPKLSAKARALIRRASDATRSQMRNRSSSFRFVYPKLPEKTFDAQSGVYVAGEVATGAAPFQKWKPQLNQILNLKWADGCLVWDRDFWKVPFANKQLKEIETEVRQILKQENVDLDIKDKNGRALWRPSRERPHFVMLFENLQSAATGYTQSSYTSILSKSWRKSLRGKGVEADMTHATDRAEFGFRETSGKSRSLRVTSMVPEALRISLVSDDKILLFDQKKTGVIKFVEVTDDNTIALTSERFSSLYKNHPEVVEGHLLPALQELGFVVPPDRYSKQFVSRVVWKLGSVDKEVADRYEELLAQVDGNSFAKRKAATEELNRDFLKYLPLLIESHRSGDLPLEAKVRLERVLSQYSEQDRAVDAMVGEMKLTSDIGYLISLLSKVKDSDRKTVIDSLQEQSNQEHGSDVEQWENWWRAEQLKQSLSES